MKSMKRWGLSRKRIIKLVKHAAAQCEGPLSRRRFADLTGFSWRSLYYRWSSFGSWTALKQAAGLPPHPKARKLHH